MRNCFAVARRRPEVVEAGVHEGFRQVAVKPYHVERLDRRFGRVSVPKVGWVPDSLVAAGAGGCEVLSGYS